MSGVTDHAVLSDLFCGRIQLKWIGLFCTLQEDNWNFIRVGSKNVFDVHRVA